MQIVSVPSHHLLAARWLISWSQLLKHSHTACAPAPRAQRPALWNTSYSNSDSVEEAYSTGPALWNTSHSNSDSVEEAYSTGRAVCCAWLPDPTPNGAEVRRGDGAGESSFGSPLLPCSPAPLLKWGAAFMKLGRALWNKVLGHIEVVAILYSTGRAPTTCITFIASPPTFPT